MSSIKTNIIDYQGIVMSDMATIIGRYKGAMGVFVNRIREIAEYEDCYGTKLMLDQLAESMSGLIADNEKLWENRGKRDVQEVA